MLSGDNMDTILAREAELQFELGGPVYRLMQRLGLVKRDDPCIGRRIVCFLLITWVPLLVLTLIEGRALGPTPRESFLLDFATYARFFIAIPLLFLAEVIVGPRLRTAGLHFLRANLVRQEDIPAVDAAIMRVRRLREALLPELVIFVFALFSVRYFNIEALSGVKAAATWSTAALNGGFGLTLAGLWYYYFRCANRGILSFSMALAADYLDPVPPRYVPPESEPGGHPCGPGCRAGISW